MTKTCSGCQEAKSRADFHKNRATSDGLCNYCKACRKRRGSPGWSGRHQAQQRFGVSAEEYHLRMELATGCAVCGSAGRLVLDHCHRTQQIRSVLCTTCNTALGHAKDDPALLRRLADYLEAYDD